jgi:hypothetical protein
MDPIVGDHPKLRRRKSLDRESLAIDAVIAIAGRIFFAS